MTSQHFADRPIKKLVLFDVDGTLTPARQVRPSVCYRIYSIQNETTAVSVTRDARGVKGAQEESCCWFRRRFRSREDH
jgi:FMN phosphatase YigB (HAD superfamily)